MNTTSDDVETPPGTQDSRDKRELRRPISGRIVAGVAAGIARSTGIDVTFVRIAFVVLTIVGITGLPFFGALPVYLLGIPLYLAGWLLMPEEGSDRSIAATMLHRLQSRAH
jgi:phage shock protein C